MKEHVAMKQKMEYKDYNNIYPIFILLSAYRPILSDL